MLRRPVVFRVGKYPVILSRVCPSIKQDSLCVDFNGITIILHSTGTLSISAFENKPVAGELKALGVLRDGFLTLGE